MNRTLARLLACLFAAGLAAPGSRGADSTAGYTKLPEGHRIRVQFDEVVLATAYIGPVRAN